MGFKVVAGAAAIVAAMMSAEGAAAQDAMTPTQIVERSGTLFFSFQELDSTKPAGFLSVFIGMSSIGFYNTFTARVAPGTTRIGDVDVSADAATGDVYALRAPHVASVQGHLESILSRDGMTTA